MDRNPHRIHIENGRKLQTISVYSRNSGAYPKYAYRAKLVVDITDSVGPCIPSECNFDDPRWFGWCDGARGYSGHASGVRYVDLWDFLHKWRAVPVRAA